MDYFDNLDYYDDDEDEYEPEPPRYTVGYMGKLFDEDRVGYNDRDFDNLIEAKLFYNEHKENPNLKRIWIKDHYTDATYLYDDWII